MMMMMMMTMIFRILLLINLISCVSGTFVVYVTQTSYQAEENHNITLEWTFTTKPDTSSNSLYIYCELFTEHLVLFRLHDGVEVSESQDQQFSGRVQFDKDVLREGRIRLHLSRLRTEDSGLYLCEVKTDYGFSSDRCRLSVTAAVHQPESKRLTLSGPHPRSWGQIILYFLLILTLSAAVLVVKPQLCAAFSFCISSLTRKKNKY
ncbi:programmed cell death 1 ligand 1-like isoform X1 [Channa argus]|uniref:programmed cell death 1 ligand 1-like isoform X1 n=1 Tax=Channa argus TaxID=215402 RepID=UPI003520AF4A